MNNNGEGSVREIAYMMMNAAHLLVLILSAPIQTPSQRFERTVFFAIIDNLLVALSKRQAAYEKLNSVFGFLRLLQLSTRDKIVKNSLNLVKMYPKDLKLSLSEDLLQFIELLNSRLSSNISKTDVPVELQYY